MSKHTKLVADNTVLLRKTIANQCLSCNGKGVIKKLKVDDALQRPLQQVFFWVQRHKVPPQAENAVKAKPQNDQKRFGVGLLGKSPHFPVHVVSSMLSGLST